MQFVLPPIYRVLNDISLISPLKLTFSDNILQMDKILRIRFRLIDFLHYSLLVNGIVQTIKSVPDKHQMSWRRAYRCFYMSSKFVLL